jgi:serine/threonine protein kinase
MEVFSDRYEVSGELGRGGMATVFRARDGRHNRDVAIKVMLPEIAASVGAERFLREIGIAARLQHPQIVPVFDSGQDGDRLYYVMPLIAGETLADRLAREGKLPLEDVVRLMSEVAEALDYAHDEGVLHRDLKPGNILLSRGHCLLADFGLASSTAGADQADPTVMMTQAGALLGTPLYMSPEQVEGAAKLGPASDIYSLACVTYELLTGKPPFSGGNIHSALARRLAEEAPRLSSSGISVPGACDEALARALARDPAARFARAGDFARALFSASSGGKPAAAAQVGDRSIAVVPFDNLSPDPNDSYLADGLVEELITDLSKVPALRVIARNSSTAARQRTGDLREIARILDVRYLLEGSVRRAGDQLRITAQLIDGSTDAHVWADKYGGTMDDVFAMQERISRTIVEELRVRLSDSPQRSAPVTNLETYELYLRAKHLGGQSVMRMPEALECLEKAIALDPQFTPALCTMGAMLSQAAFFGVVPARPTWEKVRELAGKAIAQDPLSGAGYELLASVKAYCDWDQAEAERLYEKAAGLEAGLGFDRFFHMFFLAFIGRMGPAWEQLRAGQRLDPLSYFGQFCGAGMHLWSGDPGKALAACNQLIAQDPNFPEGYHIKGYVHLVDEDYPAAEATLVKAVELSHRAPWPMAKRGCALVKLGRPDEARVLLAELEETVGTGHFCPSAIATLYLFLGDMVNFYKWMDRALEEREPFILALNTEPLWKAAWDEPEFEQRRRRIGLSVRN